MIAKMMKTMMTMMNTKKASVMVLNVYVHCDVIHHLISSSAYANVRQVTSTMFFSLQETMRCDDLPPGC